MCEPTTIALVGMGLSAASAGIGIIAQRRTAQAQEDLINEQNANAQQEIAEKASNEAGERIRAARREAARRRVAAGESGVGGQSLALDIANTYANANRDIAVVARDAMFAGRASTMRARSEMLEVRKPDAISAGLQIANAGVSGYSTGLGVGNAYQDLKIRRGKKNG